MKTNSITCIFSDVSEHDMDMLFLEEFAFSKAFLELFTGQIGIRDAKVISIISSKSDAVLGESDITVVVESNGKQIGLLVEDKIDAAAMPEQAARYSLRGEKGIQNGDYDDYYVFIIAPKKYLEQNAEAQKYPYRVEYETVLSYFEAFEDARSSFKIQQIKQAIDKQKKGYQVEVDQAVTEFWRKYSEYQQKHYPGLLLLYGGEDKGSKATWPRFNTVIDGLYIYHKTEVGYVDLTFERCADRIVQIESLLSKTVGDYLAEGFTVNRTGKSAVIRLNVPILDFHDSYIEQQDLTEICFKAVQKLSNLVRQMRKSDFDDLYI